ncbi:hypothetical protein K435DRAFT_158752 [Dendrothele bispora CBS 962.96]|uniref:Uncharacterized protein n=1 Tax=Dendrothele bispora (strain CBS 962.96) TaxID=1314807 RepID=A0A4S8MQ30_DENBC|nr:hypothetical protein K435DRAFT_158752 [Dendrothele bispora CBS 962.96]
MHLSRCFRVFLLHRLHSIQNKVRHQNVVCACRDERCSQSIQPPALSSPMICVRPSIRCAFVCIYLTMTASTGTGFIMNRLSKFVPLNPCHCAC